MNPSRLSSGLIVAALAATILLYFQFEIEAMAGRRVVIEIQNFEFMPERPSVNIGDVVVWKNMDIVPHTATSKDGSWDSGPIESGGEWETVITEDMLNIDRGVRSALCGQRAWLSPGRQRTGRGQFHSEHRTSRGQGVV